MLDARQGTKRDHPSFDGADPKRSRIGPSNEEIARAIEEREAARKSRDYARADQLRADLKAQGVEIFDVDHEWRASDGRRGSMVASASMSPEGTFLSAPNDAEERRWAEARSVPPERTQQHSESL